MGPVQRRHLREHLKEMHHLPPHARRRILRNLEVWRELPPEKRHALRERRQWLEQLPPERRRHIAEMIERWRSLPPGRREELRARFHRDHPGRGRPPRPPDEAPEQ